jgi:hypothetical protein
VFSQLANRRDSLGLRIILIHQGQWRRPGRFDNSRCALTGKVEFRDAALENASMLVHGCSWDGPMAIMETFRAHSA